ncbi:MAG: SpoIIE family protein phosphatase [bacterium]
MPSKPNKPTRGGPATGLTRGEAPMEVRQRTYPMRQNTQNRTGTRGGHRHTPGYQPRPRTYSPRTRQLSRELDERLVELQALFDVSKTLNSSLQVKQILDTLLLTPMGKMMIGKGMVLLAKDEKRFVVETLKGLQQSNIGKEIEIDLAQPGIVFLTETEGGTPPPGGPWVGFLTRLGLQLLVPIMSNNRCRGLMAFGSKINNQNYSTNEIEYLSSLANLAATAVENGLIFQELQDVNRKLDKKIQELNTLFDIGKELNSTLDSEKICSVLAYALMGELMMQRCIVLADENGRLVHQVGKGGEAAIFQNGEFLTWLAQLKAPLLLHHVNGQVPAEHAEWLEQLKVAGAAVIVPMLSQDVVRGIVLFGEKINKGEFQPEEIEFAATVGNTAMISLENARLFKETLEKQRLEEELAIARQIQQRLLPKDAPKLNNYELAALNIPTHQVGGDYFDYFPIDAHRYVLTIADVSGKGVPAALLMSNLHATLHAMMSADVPLEQIVARINNFVYANTTYDKFITFFVGVLDMQANTFTYVNGGHNPPYYFHPDPSSGEPCQFRLLDQGGLLLGMFPGAAYQVETLHLQPGDWLLMYTDGVSEAMRADEEEFSEKRIEEAIRYRLTQPACTASAMIDTITTAVKSFTAGQPQSDDITLLALHYQSENV